MSSYPNSSKFSTSYKMLRIRNSEINLKHKRILEFFYVLNLFLNQQLLEVVGLEINLTHKRIPEFFYVLNLFQNF